MRPLKYNFAHMKCKKEEKSFLKEGNFLEILNQNFYFHNIHFPCNFLFITEICMRSEKKGRLPT